MLQASKTPADQTGASRVQLGSRTPPAFTLNAYRLQFLTSACAIRPELAAMLAALAFGGGAS